MTAAKVGILIAIFIVMFWDKHNNFPPRLEYQDVSGRIITLHITKKSKGVFEIRQTHRDKKREGKIKIVYASRTLEKERLTKGGLKLNTIPAFWMFSDKMICGVVLSGLV